MPVGSAAGGGNRCGSAQSGEGSLRPHPLGIAARRDQQLGGSVGADLVGSPQAGVMSGDLTVQGPGQLFVLGGQFLDAPGEALQRGEDGDVDRVPGRPQEGQGIGAVLPCEVSELGTDGLRCGEENVGDLVQGGGACLGGGAGAGSMTPAARSSSPFSFSRMPRVAGSRLCHQAGMSLRSLGMLAALPASSRDG